ncbi:hypothetical protein EUTSA_v10023884mg [Eutrema salsugineum]|uniref:TIR domain-containing protein n=1 Tax=Eutrema salsugineum TaxID=72664 RepID=V4ME37_EUTSA|nr:hypothetical protein EUTSA_v10023884mg [Eutrema salsugineum]
MASSSSRSWRYNVFPSFHGPDVRVTFLSHLQMQFERNGITTFNDEGIERSQLIGSELTQAIRESRISIVVLSENYASSNWCLKELVEILKFQESAGQIVMTVFYCVDPCDVKKQMGELGKAFKKTCQGKTETEMESWIQALTHVANIAGEHSLKCKSLFNKSANMIEKIAKDVSEKLNATPSRDFDGMVGLEAHLGKIQSLLDVENDEAMTLGISGPAGIGNTTIARALYNQISQDFPLRYFLENVKGSYRNIDCDNHDSKLKLQEQLLSHILNQNKMKISHLDVTYESLHNQKVLIILDETDIHRFSSGSRIIVTTKDRELLHRYGINHTYHVGFPSNEEALEIIYRYALRRSSPHYGFENLAIRVTELCSNLPLGLCVVGSTLRRKSEEEWEVTMHRLEISLDGDLERVLRVGYESLHEKDQALFLHIAIIFNYKGDKIINLVNRSLIDISTSADITIHRQEPWKRHSHEICDVLEYNTGTRTVSGISFDTSEISDVFVSEGAIKRMCNLQFLNVYRRKYDENDRVCIPEDMEFPPRLSQLEKLWEGPQPLTNLKKLDLSVLSFERTPRSFKCNKPRRLKLDDCESLVEIPSSFSNLHKLQVLSMFACTRLKVIPSNMNLASLESVNRTACQKLRNFQDISRNISRLSISVKEVEQLKALTHVPHSLRDLNLSYSGVERIPYCKKSLYQLQLCLNSCRKLASLPDPLSRSDRQIVFEFCSEFKIVQCGVQIWKYESESNNNGGYQTAYSKPVSGDEKDFGNNQQDTYEFSDEEEADEYVNLNPAKRMKR